MPIGRSFDKSSINQKSAPEVSHLGASGATQLVHAAERFISRKNFSQALQTLSDAQRIDPNNAYIQAIIDRVRTLQAQSADQLNQMATPRSESGIEPLQRNAIAMTRKGEDFDLNAYEDGNMSAHEVQQRVRQLTSVADNLHSTGMLNGAFESLMKAYLLDPLSPYVLACEKTVLPAWELATRRSNETSPQLQSSFDPRTTASRVSLEAGNTDMMIPSSSGQALGVTPPLTPEQRLDMLKQQKELERVERERALWREASKPPKIFSEQEPKPDTTSLTSGPERPREDTGLFSKLKRGKFLR